MNFTNQLSFANEFSKRPKLGFRTSPVHRIPEDSDDPNSDTITVRCKPEQAEAHALYCLVQDGNLVIEEWIADLDTAEAAEQLRGLLCGLCGLDNCRLLTEAILLQLEPGAIIGTGVCLNSKIHVGWLRWVAVRGEGVHDWAIYFHMREVPVSDVLATGEKLTSEGTIRGLIPCDQGAWDLYRL